jgi:hypothetical protein
MSPDAERPLMEENHGASDNSAAFIIGKSPAVLGDHQVNRRAKSSVGARLGRWTMII